MKRIYSVVTRKVKGYAWKQLQGTLKRMHMEIEKAQMQYCTAGIWKNVLDIHLFG